MVNSDELQAEFAGRFAGAVPEVLARAPGRVNLIGEHTDYNQGYVLPAALSRGLWVAARRRDDRRLRVWSDAFRQEASLDLAEGRMGKGPGWMAYVGGTALSLRAAGFDPPGADLLIHSELPPGGGLASSAALTVACAKALTALGGGLFETGELVDICVAAERDYAGAPCGVMDPCACLMGREGAALLLDCRSLKVDYLPVSPRGARLVLIDSGVAHQNRRGQYAKRRAECQEGVTYFQQFNPEAKSLRDVDDAMLARHMQQMDPTAAARCHHVLAENRRVLKAAKALRRADPEAFGGLMLESHRSLGEQFQASCPELDRLVEIACQVSGVYGARLTGAGFGGPVLVMCEEGAVEPLGEAVRAEYAAASDAGGGAGNMLVVETSGGADWREL